jgi:protein-S-isoprenylcysteine O-methyltransferase Ste14
MGSSDRMSTAALKTAAAVPVIGLVLALKSGSPSFSSLVPRWFKSAVFPGLPAVAWLGIAVGLLGVILRLWAVLTLRERYTRTLLVHDDHLVERGGPYGWVRHPGYLGSLLCLNGIAVASGNWVTFVSSLVATSIAYGYRIKAEDQMLLASFGPSYAEYLRNTRALYPTFPKNRE